MVRRVVVSLTAAARQEVQHGGRSANNSDLRASGAVGGRALRMRIAIRFGASGADGWWRSSVQY